MGNPELPLILMTAQMIWYRETKTRIETVSSEEIEPVVLLQCN